MKCVLVWLLCAGAATGADARYRVTGVLRNAATGAPIEGARVGLEKNGSEADAITHLTGPDGKFSFEQLAPGMYSLHGERRGYITSHYGQGTMGGGIGLMVGSTDTDNIEFRLKPGAVIGGHVRDEAGEPVANALIQLVVVNKATGRNRPFPLQYEWTNDEGEYRFWDLRSGTYYVSVSAEPWFAYEVKGSGYGVQFWGGGSDARGATPIVLKPGQETRANFSLLPSPGATVTVKAENPNFRAGLLADGPNGEDIWIRTRDSVGGEAQFRGVPPGTYRATGYSLDGRAVLRSKRVEVGAGAEISVSLEVSEPPRIMGAVKLEGDAALNAAQVIVGFTSLEKGVTFRRQLGPGGQLYVPALAQGKYALNVYWRNRAYIRSLTSETAKVEANILDLSDASGMVRVAIEAGFDGGGVKGIARRGGKPAPGVFVVLAPAVDTADPSAYRLYTTDGDGSFAYQGVRPGDYVLFACSEEELEFANPAAIRQYLKNGAKVTLQAGGEVTQSVEVQEPALSK